MDLCPAAPHTQSVFQRACTRSKRKDSMEIDAGGAGLHRAAMEATPQRAHTASAQRRSASRGKTLWVVISLSWALNGAMKAKAKWSIGSPSARMAWCVFRAAITPDTPYGLRAAKRFCG